MKEKCKTKFCYFSPLSPFILRLLSLDVLRRDLSSTASDAVQKEYRGIMLQEFQISQTAKQIKEKKKEKTVRYADEKQKGPNWTGFQQKFYIPDAGMRFKQLIIGISMQNALKILKSTILPCFCIRRLLFYTSTSD